ncbi:MAG: hypothetical protein L3J21_08465 [Devosiaceae bacterium]|nr:hypothetical protein [Devosiaceae bacterium]
MSEFFLAIALILVISIAADFRVLNALICLFNSVTGTIRRQLFKGTNK